MNRGTRSAQERSITRLEERLRDGDELIDKRRAAGLDVTKLEDFWIALLHEYEQACQEIAPDSGVGRASHAWT